MKKKGPGDGARSKSKEEAIDTRPRDERVAMAPLANTNAPNFFVPMNLSNSRRV